MYTIHIQVADIAPACVYALLPNKTEADYNRFLKAALDFASYCSSSQILIDFELAAANAFKEHFPSAELRGCYFHLTQKIDDHQED